MWVIWCKDTNDYLRENQIAGLSNDKQSALLVFPTRKTACERAARHYHYKTYAEVKAHDWCEVRRFEPPT